MQTVDRKEAVTILGLKYVVLLTLSLHPVNNLHYAGDGLSWLRLKDAHHQIMLASHPD